MGCDVCIGSEPDFLIADYEVSEAIAEKEEQCLECKSPIPAGSKYELVSGNDENEDSDEDEYGEPVENVHFTTCVLCAEIAEQFCCGEGRTHGILWEEMRDIAFPELTLSTECFTLLSIPAKNFLLDRWKKWKGLA